MKISASFSFHFQVSSFSCNFRIYMLEYNYSEPYIFTFCECLHSNRIVKIHGEVTTCAKEKLFSSGFVNKAECPHVSEHRSLH